MALPPVLNTVPKRQMCAYIRKLIPDKYFFEFDAVVAALPPLDGEAPPLPVRHPDFSQAARAACCLCVGP